MEFAPLRPGIICGMSEVRALLERIAPLWDIDVSSVAPEETA